MRITRRFTLAAFAAAALALAVPGPAAAAPQQEGLVNVNVSGVDVQVPISVAANICNVGVNVLASQVDQTGDACTTDATSVALIPGGGENGGSPRQEGLVNVNVSDVDLQVPLSVAANVCNLGVNAIAQNVQQTGDACESDATSVAWM